MLLLLAGQERGEGRKRERTSFIINLHHLLHPSFQLFTLWVAESGFEEVETGYLGLFFCHCWGWVLVVGEKGRRRERGKKKWTWQGTCGCGEGGWSKGGGTHCSWRFKLLLYSYKRIAKRSQRG